MLTTIQRLLWSGMVCCCLALAGCDTVFDVHPYDVHIRGEKNLNAKGVAAIEAATLGKDTLRLAFISDSHSRNDTWTIHLTNDGNVIARHTNSNYRILCL